MESSEKMIDVEYKTDDPERREIVDRYLAMDDRGRFIEKVSEIASDYEITWKQVLSVVRSSSTIRSTVHWCEVCGSRKEFTSRKDIRENRAMDTYLCSRDCRAEKRQEETSTESGQETPPNAAEQSRERLLRERVGRVTEALSGVTEKLSTISSELRGIKSHLKREHGAGKKIEETC
ncbi:hypothetical protein [Salinibacter ruber]|jgi:hypothetical protein|uniref:hypothetical protein n=1 Tax=Salinibacter ruber TaxID=146919 RepID=UPI0021680398|nr:hypothetical protein [Salinibacter ruber]